MIERGGRGGTNGGTQDHAEVSALDKDVLDTELLRPERGFDPADDHLSVQARLRGLAWQNRTGSWGGEGTNLRGDIVSAVFRPTQRELHELQRCHGYLRGDGTREV